MDTVAALLHYYRFDCGTTSLDQILQDWERYDPTWIKLAIVEAIYRGRYKTVSVAEILRFWQRRGEPHYRFSHEFERSICGDFVFSIPHIVRKPFSAKHTIPPLSLPVLNWEYSETSPFEDRLRALCLSIH